MTRAMRVDQLSIAEPPNSLAGGDEERSGVAQTEVKTLWNSVWYRLPNPACISS